MTITGGRVLGELTFAATRDRRRKEQRHLILLAVAAVAILLVPWLLVDKAWQRTQAANQHLDHAHRVGILLYRLQADIRDFEAAALTLSKGVSTPLVRDAMSLSQGFDGTINELSFLLEDDGSQLMRLGQIKSRLERRTQLAHALARESDPQIQRPMLTELVSGSPIRGLVNELQTAENARLQHRQLRLEQQAERERYIRMTALVMQFCLMAFVLWLMWRQLRDRLMADRLLADAGDQARQVFQAVREPIALVDGNLQVVSSNPAYIELVTAGEPGHAPVLWEDSVLAKRLQDVINRKRELWDYEHSIRDAHGVQRDLVINARRIRVSTSQSALALVTISDVTTQRAAQHRVEELNRQLEGKIEQISEVNRELEAFSYSVSHDLRAPLRHIAGFADKLSERIAGSADEKSMHYLDVIGRSARRMSQLIDDLLVYSRLGRGALRLQAVDMQSLAEETRALIESNLHNEAVAGGEPQRRIEWKIAPLPMVLADENMMRQVWLNLLGNAAKYTARTEVARIEVSAERQEDGQYCFTVADNGAGFDMAYAGKLFGVFQRMHKESEFSGTGIGLASVRRVLSRHDGRIWAEAQVGEGARFHFTLPAYRDRTD